MMHDARSKTITDKELLKELLLANARGHERQVFKKRFADHNLGLAEETLIWIGWHACWEYLKTRNATSDSS